jgi:CheY-like chemotaxis protein
MDKKYVLIVEDSASQAIANCLLLENTGVNVLWARNGWEALDMAVQYLPHVIILDVQMPEIDGFEVCHRLKANPRTAPIPVIMYTSRDFAPDLMRGLELGAVDYIPKDSFSGTVLLSTLKELGVIK